VGFLGTSAKADTLGLVTAADHTTGYSRALFKHWIDADKDGCDTRAEVLIEEAITKPKVGAKCALTGGKWLSAYDGVEVTSASKLDVDHMVPLAEAWRSGAWKWSAAQRQAYANDLDDSRALIAVTLTSNRTKGDKDPALWMPAKEKCTYIENWIAIKVKYSLTVDSKEKLTLQSQIGLCGITNISFLDVVNNKNTLPSPIISILEEKPGVLNIVEVGVPELQVGVNPKYSYLIVRQTEQLYTERGFSCTLQGITFRGDDRNFIFNNFDIFNGKNNKNGIVINLLATPNTYKCFLGYGTEYEAYIFAGTDKGKLISISESVKFIIGERIQALPSPTPSPSISSNELTVNPGAFCSPAGAIGKASSGVTYTCKTSPTDSRNRWRQ
jgi:hypothetical protein